MIQSVNFMGKGSNVAKKVFTEAEMGHEYLGAGSYIDSKLPTFVDSSKSRIEAQTAKINEAVKAKYAPFTVPDKTAEQAEQMGKDWATAHGIQV